MTVNKQHAKEQFAAYTANYDPGNPRIALKIAHTYRVAALCKYIARSEGFDPNLAWLCGLLHDIGRFEQVRRYDTFNDARSVSHALLGVDVLFGNIDSRGTKIRDFLSETCHDDLIRTVIATHSDYRLPEDLEFQTRAMCDVLRDADKIDIIKVNCICPIEDIYGVSSEEMDASELSPAVVEMFYRHQTVPRGIRQYPADILVGHICFAWELVYPTSRQTALAQGYLWKMLGKRFTNSQTQKTFEQMEAHMREYLP